MKNPEKLEDTVELMTGSDYKDRIKAEYWQVRLRREALLRFIDALDCGALDIELAYDRDLLDEQAGYMQGYEEALEERAEKEGINLLGFGAGYGEE